jgi:hypothetical protein
MIKKMNRNLAGNFLSLLFSQIAVLSMRSALTAATRLKSQPPVDPAEHQAWLTE